MRVGKDWNQREGIRLYYCCCNGTPQQLQSEERTVGGNALVLA